MAENCRSNTSSWCCTRDVSIVAPNSVWSSALRVAAECAEDLAAEIDGVTIDPQALVLPETDRPLVVEGAGGLLVPLTRDITFIEMFRRWQAPVVLCARTTLGTINHTLLSIEALRTRGIALLGIAFMGEENLDSERIIVEIGRVRRLGRLPRLESLTAESLRAAFARHFDRNDFL